MLTKPPRPPVNVIVPVYRGIDETRRCLTSLLMSGLPAKCRITIIDDCSPDAEMPAMLQDFAADARVSLLRNQENLGFVASVNLGMRHHADCDPVLLNSDTEVPYGWLQRLQRSVYSAADIGTATPFSNNATLCSYPIFCTDNPLPFNFSLAALDRLFQEANAGCTIDIPTAVGFCMYIRQDCLAATGDFDAIRFGKGYGEENDFCMRASARGWRHVLCADTFVFHSGEVSFTSDSAIRKQRAYELLCTIHPDYAARIQRHLLEDPARTLRLKVDALRFRLGQRSVILLVSHDLGGGTARHLSDLAEFFTQEADFLLLSPGYARHLELAWLRKNEIFRLYFRFPDDFSALLDSLRLLGIIRVHFHHHLHLPNRINDIPSELGVPYDVTLHDFHMLCPRLTLTGNQQEYCGMPDTAECDRCLAINHEPVRNISVWRETKEGFLRKAARIFAPSRDTQNRFASIYPHLPIVLAPHLETSASAPEVAPPMAAPGTKMRVVVIGRLSVIKGAELLEACALNAEQRNLPLEFHLIGSGWRMLKTAPQSRLTLTGPYREADLAALLDQADPHLIWFPAQWPETYSYTLSAALKSRYPIAVPDIGAFAERVSGRPWIWIFHWQASAQAWNDRFLELYTQHYLTGTPPSLTFHGLEAGSAVFNWRTDYIASQPSQLIKEGWENSAALLAQHAKPIMPLIGNTLLPLRKVLLTFGLRLRSHPAMQPLVRRFPSALTYRIRNWLRGIE